MTDGTTYDPDLMAAVTDLGDALRGLVDASVRTAVGIPTLAAAAAQAREVAARLAAERRPQHQLSALDDTVVFRRVYNPVTGVGSALAPPLDLRSDDDGGIVAETTLGLAYEGPPGFLHGGMSGCSWTRCSGRRPTPRGCGG